MKQASGAVCSTLALLSLLHGAAAQDNAGLKPITPKGCFSSSEGLEDQGSYTFQASGYCQKKCVELNKPVMALAGGSNCWCGDLLPVASSGGENAWTVLLTGLNNNVGSVQDSSSDSSSNSNDKPKPPSKVPTPPAPTSTAAAKAKPSSPLAANAEPDTTDDEPPSTVTRAATVVVTAPGQTQPAAEPAETQAPSKGPNTGGIVAGVVVGIVAILAIAGGLFFFLRNRKRRAVEEEYQRNNVNNPFEIESKPPPSSHSMSDSRLEPSVMMQRRQSDGSIADNQDYSRRILKVTNPD
ncbi:MAG: hypothetical protein LQ341_000648, partial [Variospora aurantia]